MILHQMVVQRGRLVIEKKEWKRMINKKNKGGLGWIRNKILSSVWIKDLPMLYYSILDDELI